MTSCTAATVTFLSAPATHQFYARSGCYNGQFAKSSPSKHLSLPSLSCTNSSTSSVKVIEEEDKPSSTTGGLFTSGCKACGREEMEKGCNGEGSIQGGIATVPGFGWWPIKAYRPCPEFVASGGRYRRVGQSMDEVAFGKVEKTVQLVEKPIPLKIKDKEEPRKKKQGRRKLKR